MIKNARIKLVPAKGVAGNRGPKSIASGGGIEFMAGDGPATLTGGFGGQWETVSRPGRAALTRYVGRDPIAQDVPILIDGYLQGKAIQPLVTEWLHWLAVTGQNGPPPVWKVSGPIHYPNRKWVVTDVEFGDAMRNKVGALVRQEATLKLIEYINADPLRVRKVPVKVQPKKAKTGSMVAAKNRNLRQIAQVYYGTVKAAKPLGLAQKPPIKDVQRKLTRKIKLVRVGI